MLKRREQERRLRSNFFELHLHCYCLKGKKNDANEAIMMYTTIEYVFSVIEYMYVKKNLVGNEIFRQRDKANNNDIGYFHQRIFQYMHNRCVPDNGKEGGWDVIFHKDEGITLPDGDVVHTVYVEMKNKHNTMNSASAGKTYIKMQHQLLEDDDCACFLVEAIAKRSQNIKWSTTVDRKTVSHKRIRRVSMDQFYALVTGEDDAFYQMCMFLPDIIEKVVSEGEDVKIPPDTVIDELRQLTTKFGQGKTESLSMAIAIYMLGFSTYSGFSKTNTENEDLLKRLYEYAKRLRNQ